MSPRVRFLFACVLGLGSAGLLHAAELPAEWKHFQTLQLPRTGLIKIGVPLETLSAARRGLEDLRFYDDAGKETPFLLEHPAPTPAAAQAPRQLNVTVANGATVVTLETGFTESIASVTLQTPAPSFLKAVRLEGSQNGKDWDVLAQGQPIFRQPNGTSQLDLTLPPARWSFLRLTLDDGRAAPIPITGAILRAETGAPTPEEPLGLALAVDRWPFRKLLPIERNGVQRVELDLEVLTRAAPGLRDLRVMRDGRQIPCSKPSEREG